MGLSAQPVGVDLGAGSTPAPTGDSMMKVKMLRRELGSDRDADGIALPVRAYPRDGVFTLGDELAKTFIQMGAAAPYDPVKTQAAPENKMQPGPTGNKKRGRK